MPIKRFIQRMLGNDTRTRLARKNILANILLKACTGIIILALVPLTLRCLGEYANGVWLTISAALLWFENLDIGLGNGLRNKLAEFVAEDDWEQARSAVSTTFVLLTLIIVPVTLLLLVGIYTSDMYTLLNVDAATLPDLPNIIAVSLILFASTLIMKFIGNVYLGLQLPAVSNLLITGGHPLILIGTLLLYFSGSHSVMAIAALNFCVPLCMYLAAYPYTFFYKYPRLRPSLRCFSKALVPQLFALGILFFLNQVTSSVIFLSSNVFISKWFSPAAVTPYQIAYRYFSIIILIFAVINTPNWSATTDAYKRGDMAWIRKTVRNMDHLLLGFFVLIVMMIAASNVVYRYWIGPDITIPLPLTISMGLYIFVMIYSLAYCYFLNGMGILRLQLLCSLLGIAIYIISVYVLSGMLGDVSSISIAITLALLPNAIVNKIQFTKVMNHTASGIWKK